jgi:hypothetical protein
MKGEMSKSFWTADDEFFVTGGKKYGITPDGRTVCLGDFANEQTDLEPQMAVPLPQGAVSKMKEVENHSQSNYETAKRRGRPRKTEGISRITRWRREKEAIQGVLAL